MGLSDPISAPGRPNLDEWSSDIGTVMDTVGVGPAALFATGGGSQLAMLFAASHPDRVSHLILLNATARGLTEHRTIPAACLTTYGIGTSNGFAAWGTPGVLRLFGQRR